jgi:WD40 repeat protein
VTGARALPNGRLLSWSQDNILRLWDGDTGAALATLKGHTNMVYGALALPDGRLLSWSGDKTLRLWDGATGAAIATLEGHTERVTGARALPNGRLLSWSEDLTLRTWDSTNGAPLKCTYKLGRTGYGRGLALSHAGHLTRWHADGNWKADHLIPDGTLVALCDKHLAILHLHQGNRRVSVEEAERLILSDRVEPT